MRSFNMTALWRRVAAALVIVGFWLNPLCALEVKIDSAKMVGDKLVMVGSLPDSASGHSVAAWWCGRAPMIPGASHLSITVETPSITFTCEYSSTEKRVASCDCEPDVRRADQNFSLDYLWEGKSQYGQTLFLRVSSNGYSEKSAAVVFASSIQKELFKTNAYLFRRWVFLFDLESEPERGDRYSIGKVVLTESGDLFDTEGSWLGSVESQAGSSGDGWVDPFDLKVGSTYRLSKETPLMSTATPVDPMKELAKTLYLPKGTKFTIVSVTEPRPGYPWYEVRGQASGQSFSGYINCVALIGQDL